MTKKRILLTLNLIMFISLMFSKISFASDDSDYNKEGRLTVKLRLGGAFAKEAKITGIPLKENKKIIKNGFGLEGASIIFFNDYLATELFMGLNVYKIDKVFIKNIAEYYSNDIGTSIKGSLYSIPLGLNLQYYIAPFGAIRPYVGGGYHVNFLFSTNKYFSKNMQNNYGYGGILQTGVDFVFKDDTTIGVDIKKYWLSSKMKYKSLADNIKSKLQINPVIIALSFGYNF